MIFRWAIWGEYAEGSAELLRYSIRSFRKQFGIEHRYVLHCDTACKLSRNIMSFVEIYEFGTPDIPYNTSSTPTWRKWCPNPRIDINSVEVYVDADVFLLQYPKELDIFLADPRQRYAILDEYKGAPWQHGSMTERANGRAPYVNAGFFVQKRGYSISDKLEREYQWWQKHVPRSQHTHHDEQGALAIALIESVQNGWLFVLPKIKYILIGPNENCHLKSLGGITMFHAVYPEHPAFYKFKDTLDEILSRKH